MQKLSHKNDSSELHKGLPSLGVLHQEDKPPRNLFLFLETWFEGLCGFTLGAPQDWGK